MTTKKELIYAVANRTGFKKSSVELLLNIALAEIEHSLLAGQASQQAHFARPSSARAAWWVFA